MSNGNILILIWEKFSSGEALNMGFIDSISNSIQKPQQNEIRAKLNNFKSIDYIS